MPTIPTDFFDVVIVGGGASGLSALATLSSTKNLLLECSSTFGGRVETLEFDSVSAELGAFYPLKPLVNNKATNEDNDEFSTSVLFIESSTQSTSFSNFHQAFCLLSGGDKFDNSSLFSDPYLVNNPLLNLKLKNPRYGDLSLLSSRQLSLVESLHQITHPGNISTFPSNLRPICLDSLPSLSRHQSNNSALLSLFPIQSNSKVELNSTVLSIKELNEYVEVTFIQNEDLCSVNCKFLILTPPPPACFHLLHTINDVSSRFYQSSPYLGGWSIVLYYQGSIPNHSVFVSSNFAWSACFITHIDDDHFVVNSYVPITRISYLKETDLVEYLRYTLSCYLPNDVTLLNSHAKYWKYLAPQISQCTIDNYTPGHSRLGDRVIYGGELSAFTLRNMYAYGLNNAINAGKTAAHLVLDLISQENSGCSKSSLPPLLTAFVYNYQLERPIFIGSQKEGNIAFYGLILSSTYSKTIYRYLLNHSVNGLWEYHTGFGCTLEDTLLVLEGLIDSGLDEVAYKHYFDKCIDSFYDHESGLFITLVNGRADYWQGPSIHGTVHAYYLILKYYPDIINTLQIHELIDYLYSEFSNTHSWSSRWFCNSHFTSFYVIRLLCILPSSMQVCDLVYLYFEKLIQTQLYNGSWDNSLISTACALLSLKSIIDSKIVDIKSDVIDKISRGVDCVNDLHHKTHINEPILYYWYDTFNQNSESSKRFFHCVDNGLITKSLIDLSLRSVASLLADTSASC